MIRIRETALTILISRPLRMVDRIYKEQKRLLVKELKVIYRVRRNPRTTPSKKAELYFECKMYVVDFRQHLIITAFLMLHSYLEETLLLLTPEPGAKTKASRKTGLERSKEIFLEDQGLNLSDFPQWQLLKDFAKIRHLILHANANVRLVKDAAGVEPLLKRQRQYVYHSFGRLRLREAILTQFKEVLFDFVRWIFTYKKMDYRTEKSDKTPLEKGPKSPF